MAELSEHCLCDHCSGKDCEIFTEEEQKQNQKDHDAKVREDLLDKLECMMDDGIHYTDYSGKTISLPVERWDEIIKSLRD
jgi:hypothetical protein